MKMVVSGGTGFLGRPLCETAAEDGHEVIVLTRTLKPGEAVHDGGTGVPGVTRVGWRADGQLDRWARHLDGADAVVNLAGESLAARRWTPIQKARVRDSRLLATRGLVSAVLAASRPPQVFVSGSAVGFYGFSRGDHVFDESSSPSDDFLARLCVDWEQEALRAARPETRVVLIRAGVVLELDGGPLPKFLTPFRWFAGGPIGSGRQYLSWIHKRDWLELVRWTIDTPSASGPLNATAPEPVTSREFARALGRALGRPSLLPAPSLALRLLYGEMADAMLLGGQRVVPTRPLALGFEFRFPEIDRAFRAIFER
jgi:hypothetical protein